MFAIRRSDGLFLCDGPLYKNKKLPQPVWQAMEGTRKPYLEISLHYITARRDKLAKIYVRHKLEVIELDREQEEYIAFRKLRGY